MVMRTCELLFRGEGRILPGFMCGRQMWVTNCSFIMACVTTLLDIEVGTRTTTTPAWPAGAFFFQSLATKSRSEASENTPCPPGLATE